LIRPMMVSRLADRPLKNKAAPRSQSSQQSPGGPAFDDDIPFSNFPRKSLTTI